MRLGYVTNSITAVYQFQSTHPIRECDNQRFSHNHSKINFNPRTLQESATDLIDQLFAVHHISIHAPYKRVRRSRWCNWLCFFLISIHAPYKRVRLVAENVTFLDSKKFQSTHPTRECDNLLWPAYAAYVYFNPRTLQESATTTALVILVKLILFQSTHPTRECDCGRKLSF